jgi:hypothetical protein
MILRQAKKTATAPGRGYTLYVHDDDRRPGPLHPKLKALLAVWEEKRGSHRMPSREDLPVQALKPWLGHLALLETAAGGFRFRICGTELIPRCGGEATGRGLHELPPEMGASIADILCCATDRSAPVVAALILPHEDGTQLYSELVLPLRDRDLPSPLLLLGSYSILR